MQGTLKYDLLDSCSKYEFYCAQQGSRVQSKLRDLDNELRNIVKYEGTMFEGKEIKSILHLAEVIREYLHDEGVIIDERLFRGK